MSDESTATATRKSRKPLLFGLLGVVLLIVLALLAGWLYAGSEAKSYASDQKAWEAKDRKTLLAASKRIDKKLFDTDAKITKKHVATQQEKCDAISERRASLKKASDALPEPSVGFLSVLRPSLDTADRRAEKNRSAVDAYVKEVDGALAQVERDCTWNQKYLAVAKKLNDAWDKQEKYVDPYKPTGEIQCHDKENGCIPSSLSRRAKYVKTANDALDVAGERVKLEAGKECATTSYGDFCSDLSAWVKGDVAASRAWYKWLKTTKAAADIPNLDKQNKKRKKASDKAYKAMEKAAKKKLADIDLDYGKSNPDWPTAVFYDVALQYSRDMASAADELEKKLG